MNIKITSKNNLEKYLPEGHSMQDIDQEQVMNILRVLKESIMNSKKLNVSGVLDFYRDRSSSSFTIGKPIGNVLVVPLTLHISRLELFLEEYYSIKREDISSIAFSMSVTPKVLTANDFVRDDKNLDIINCDVSIDSSTMYLNMDSITAGKILEDATRKVGIEEIRKSLGLDGSKLLLEPNLLPWTKLQTYKLECGTIVYA